MEIIPSKATSNQMTTNTELRSKEKLQQNTLNNYNVHDKNKHK